MKRRITNFKPLFSLFIIISLVSCISRRNLSYAEQVEYAEKKLSFLAPHIVNKDFNGGENIQYQILNVQYDNSDDLLLFKLRIDFNGQWTGYNYWAEGASAYLISDNKTEYIITNVDPALTLATGFQVTIEHAAVDALNNALKSYVDQQTK